MADFVGERCVRGWYEALVKRSICWVKSMRKLLFVLSVAGVLRRRGVGDGDREGEGRFRDGRGVASSAAAAAAAAAAGVYMEVLAERIASKDRCAFPVETFTYCADVLDWAFPGRFAEFGKQGHFRNDRECTEASVIDIGLVGSSKCVVNVWHSRLFCAGLAVIELLERAIATFGESHVGRNIDRLLDRRHTT